VGGETSSALATSCIRSSLRASFRDTVLMFADEMILYRPIHSHEVYLLLQMDIYIYIYIYINAINITS